MRVREPRPEEAALLDRITTEAQALVPPEFGHRDLGGLINKRASAAKHFARHCAEFGLADHSPEANEKIVASVRRGAIGAAEHGLLSIALNIKTGITDRRQPGGKRKRLSRSTALIMLEELDRDRSDFGRDASGANDPVKFYYMRSTLDSDLPAVAYRMAWKAKRNELSPPLEQIRKILTGSRVITRNVRSAIRAELDKLPLEMWQDSRDREPIAPFAADWNSREPLHILQGRECEAALKRAIRAVDERRDVLSRAFAEADLSWLKNLPLHRDPDGRLSDVGLAAAEKVLMFRISECIIDPNHAFGRPLAELDDSPRLLNQASKILGPTLPPATPPVEQRHSPGRSLL